MPKGLFEKYSSLPERKKKLIAFGGFFAIICILGLFLYSQKKPPKKREKLSFEEVVPEVRLLEKTLYEKTTLKTRELEREIKRLKAELQKTRKELEQARKQKQIPSSISELEKKIERLEAEIGKKGSRIAGKTPPPPGRERPSGVPGMRRFTGTGKKPVQPVWSGGIGVKRPEKTGERLMKKEEEKKTGEKKNVVYLPPCWVEGDLLTGFAAFSSNKGRRNPIRIMVRLRDLAVLPNEVKADLKGCYVIGEAYGDLADERAHVRLLRLSCISRSGDSVIDEGVKGWVVDEDGRIGLRGRVVTKMGAFLTRYLISGFLQGFGEAYSSTAYDLSVGGGEVVKLAKPGEAAKAGIGKGIGKVGENLSDFYLDLAKQTLPVIEVGAGKRVVVIFSEGKDLRIRKKCLRGRDGCVEEKRDYALSSLADYF